MGDQRKNWGVSWAWFDRLIGSREVFVGSEKDRADHPKNAARARAAAEGRGTRATRPLREVLGEVFKGKPKKRAGNGVPAAA